MLTTAEQFYLSRILTKFWTVANIKKKIYSYTKAKRNKNRDRNRVNYFSLWKFEHDDGEFPRELEWKREIWKKRKQRLWRGGEIWYRYLRAGKENRFDWKGFWIENEGLPNASCLENSKFFCIYIFFFNQFYHCVENRNVATEIIKHFGFSKKKNK